MRVLMIGRHIRRILGIVDCRLWDICVAIHVRARLMSLGMALRVTLRMTLRRSIRPDLRSHEIGTHAPHIVAGARSGARVRLWSVGPRNAVEDHAIRYGWRR